LISGLDRGPFLCALIVSMYVIRMPPTGKPAVNSAYVMMSRVKTFDGLAFISTPNDDILLQKPDYQQRAIMRAIASNSVATHSRYERWMTGPRAQAQSPRRKRARHSGSSSFSKDDSDPSSDGDGSPPD
jgi:hypothetical protein